MRSFFKPVNVLKIALGLLVLSFGWIAFQLGTHRHTGILRALNEAKHFLSDASMSAAGAQQQKTTRPPGPQHKVTLSWKASPSPIVGYNVYRRGASGVVKLNMEPVPATTYIDTTVQPGQTYFYVTKAVNAKGTESTPSNEVRVDVPQ
jgi:fibronectin type 3 domain-containing protein